MLINPRISLAPAAPPATQVSWEEQRQADHDRVIRRLGVISLFVASFSAVVASLALAAAAYLALTVRENSERQLRAYISITPPAISADDWTPTLKIENNGQTPARDVKVRLTHHSVPVGQPLPKTFSFPDVGNVESTSVAVLNSQKSAQFTFPSARDAVVDVTNGVSALFFYGHAQYADVFGNARLSRFNYQFVPILKDGKIVGQRLVLQSTYNHSD
jgi:hypothetical protein